MTSSPSNDTPETAYRGLCLLARRRLFAPLLALAAASLAFANGAVAQSHDPVCIENGGNRICKMAVQYAPRYAPAYYRSINPGCNTEAPPVVPPYAVGRFDTEGPAITLIHDTQVCDAGPLLCDPGSMTPVQPFIPEGSTMPGYEPARMYRAASSTSPASQAFLWQYGRRDQNSNCVAQSRTDFGMAKDQPIVCPKGFAPYGSPWTGLCTAPVMSQLCPIGNPIDPGIGAKTFRETDFDGDGTLRFSRRYYSFGYEAPGSIAPDDGKSQVLGTHWRTPYDSRLHFLTGSTTMHAAVVNDNGTIKYFRTDGSEYPHYSDTPVESLANNGDGTWTLTRGDDSREVYDAQGRLLSLWDKKRLARTLAYGSDGRLQSVTDVRGRVLGFEHFPTADAGRIVVMTTPAGQQYHYTLDRLGNLVDVTLPGGKQRAYAYENASLYHAITRITDENGSAYEAVTYDGSGRATSSWLAPGTQGDTIARNTIVYSGGKATITDPLGLQRDLNYTVSDNVIRLGSTSQPCGSCGSNFQTQTYDANGYPDRRIDFRGNEVDTDYDARGLQTQRREGQIAANGQCPVGSTYFSANYGSACTTGTCWANQPFAGSTSGAAIGFPTRYYSCTVTATPLRTAQTIWHATLREPVERKILGASSAVETITRWQYNARGQTIARCEIDPADATYVCDATIAPPSGAKVRRWTYTYCESFEVAAPNSTCPVEGLLKSVDGPRRTTDAGMGGASDLTTYTYYPADLLSGCGALLDEPCHRKGDLWKVTNALGHVTEHLAYDRNGRLLRSKDANGTITDYTYDVRDRLTSKRLRANANGSPSSNDAITTMTYDDAGNVTRTTQPDGAYLNYTYDAAYRLTDVVDNLGNRIHYTLDPIGNRLREETYDATYDPATPGVGLKRSMTRVYNELNRLTKTLNANLLPTRDSTSFNTGVDEGYDPNGNAVLSQDGLGVVTQQAYDGLNRLTKTMQDYQNPVTDPETANTTTQYRYDARGNLLEVIDPDTLSTTYAYDGLGNLTDIDSPDTGHTDYSYDSAGNRIVQTDNRSRTSTYVYDPLNRLTATGYPTASLDITFAYDEPDAVTGCSGSFPIGRLTRMIDASGVTTYCYDRRGNTTRKTHLAGGVALSVDYAFDKADRVTAITYPSGAIVGYTRDLVGRITGVSWKANASAAQINVVSSASYLPFGPLNLLTYGSGRTLTKTYDADYAIDSIESSASDGLKLDFSVDVMGNITAASDTLGASTPTRRYVHDRLYRLSRVDDGANVLQEDYAYTKTGDRTLRQFAGQAAQIYTYLAGTHHLGAVDGTNRTYDGNGNTTGRGDGKTFTYDDRNRLALVGAGSTQYHSNYNGKGERVSKFMQTVFVTGQPTRYVHDESGLLLTRREPSSTFVDYVYLDARPVAQISGGTLTYLETDHLGTPRVAADRRSSARLWSWDYFGSAFGEHAASGSIDVNLRYPGQTFDAETGMHYNYFRDYDPAVGRYLESDPKGLKGGIDTYLYADGDPLYRFDRFGLQSAGQVAYSLGCQAIRIMVYMTCKLATSCDRTDECSTIELKIHLKGGCINAQEALTKECFANNPSHGQRLTDETAGMARCMKILKEKTEDGTCNCCSP